MAIFFFCSVINKSYLGGGRGEKKHNLEKALKLKAQRENMFNRRESP